MKYVALWACVLALIVFVALFFVMAEDAAACDAVEVTPNTPTGVAGCFRVGDGIASHYGPGDGVAMNFCTWTLRHSNGCGWVTITSHDTGKIVTVPVVDFCDCYTNTAQERIVDLQYGVVAALGLDLARGLYPVTVNYPDAALQPTTMLPNTAMQGD